MSKFDVQVRKIVAIEAHPKADKLEVACIEGYRAVVRKGLFKEGDLVVYLPEAAVLPEFVLRTVGLWNEAENKGLCGGELGDRVRTVVLRGFISQGIVYPLAYLENPRFGAGWYLEDGETGIWKVSEGQDVATILGVTKHVPQIPAGMVGEVQVIGRHLMPSFDVEDIKKYPYILKEGEDVFITEKLHGIMTGAVLLPAHEAIDGKRFFVFSKGLGQDGLAFVDDEANAHNVYLKAVRKNELQFKLEQLVVDLGETENPVFILGETFGMGVQDLGYGATPDFRAFAIGVGFRGREQYLDYLSARKHAEALGVRWVPELYRGPYSAAIVAQVISGKETLTGKEVHLREGGVIEPAMPRQSPEIGRVVLKAVSPEYLSRPGHTTEYQ
jgi:RNA ligase (TIGR02306 family)